MTIYNATDATFQKELQGTGLTVVNFRRLGADLAGCSLPFLRRMMQQGATM